MNPMIFGGLASALGGERGLGAALGGIPGYLIGDSAADKAEEKKANRRKALAAALSSAMPQAPQQQMQAGGMAVPMTTMGGLAQGLQPVQDHLRQKRIAEILAKRDAGASVSNRSVP